MSEPLYQRFREWVRTLGGHVLAYEVANLPRDCRPETCERCNARDLLRDYHAYLTEALELVRYYRTRSHFTPENEDGDQSPYHRVHGVHYGAMMAADAVIQQAKANGYLQGEVREWH